MLLDAGCETIWQMYLGAGLKHTESCMWFEVSLLQRLFFGSHVFRLETCFESGEWSLITFLLCKSFESANVLFLFYSPSIFIIL